MSRSKVGVKIMGQGQRSRSNFWCAAVDIRGSALPSAAKSIRIDYQSEVFVCVSVIRGRIRIIARMRSVGALIFFVFFCHSVYPCIMTGVLGGNACFNTKMHFPDPSLICTKNLSRLLTH